MSAAGTLTRQPGEHGTRTPPPSESTTAGESARTALAAGVASALGALAFGPVFVVGSWAPPALGAVAVVTAGGLALRAGVPWAVRLVTGGRSAPERLSSPALSLVPLGQLLLVLCFLTWVFAPGRSTLGFLPTPSSLADLADVLRSGGSEVRTQATPALALDGLVALTALAVAAVALAVDMVAVGAGQPALGGLGLLVLYCVPVSTVTGSIGVPTFLGPAVGFAVLLWADQRARLDDRVRSGPGAPLGTGTLTALRTGALALVAGLVLPLFIPTVTEGTFGSGSGGDGPGSTGTGLDPFAELSGQLTLPSPIPLLRVRASVDDPEYLRAVTLDEYTPQGWRLGDLSDRQPINGQDALSPLPPGVPSREVTATVVVDQQDDRFLPVFTSPLSVQVEGAGRGDWRFDPLSDTVFGRGTTTAGRTYTVTAEEPRPTEDQLRASAPRPPDAFTSRFTALPPLDPAVTDLVTRLTAGVADPYDRVRAVHDYFSDRANGFVYSLATQQGTSGDDLVDFLRSKQGFCQQYAGAMAVLVRAAGVPARVVLGYTPGQVQPDGTRLVTSSDAHAWVEAWFEGIGWVPFDPTPIQAARAVQLPWAPRADAPVETTPDSPAAPVTPAPLPSGATADNGEGAAPITLGTARGRQSSSLVPWLRYGGATLLVLGLLAVPAVSRGLQRRRRVAGGRAGALWDELTDTAADLGFPVPGTSTPRQTARALAERIAPVAPEAVPALRDLALAEEGSSFGRPTGDPAGPLAALELARHGLQRSASPGARLRAALWPVSTTTALRTRVTEPLRRRSRAA